MRSKPPLRAWIWPPPPIARRIWLVILAASAYSLVVFLFFGEMLARMPGWSSEFGLVNGIVLGVLVGIRTRAAFDRWFEGQKLWGEVQIHARNLALKVAHLVRANSDDRRIFAALVTALTHSMLARLRDRDPHYQSLKDLPPVPPGTLNVPAYFAGQLLSLSSRWHAAGKLDLPGLWAMEANIRAMLDVLGNCERIAMTPIPISFHALLRHGLLLSLILAPWHLIHTLGAWAIPVQALVIYFLFGVELTAEEVENPFGTDIDDLPLEAVLEAIRVDVGDIMRGAESPPQMPSASPADVRGAIPTVTGEDS